MILQWSMLMLAAVISDHNAEPSAVSPVTTWHIISKKSVSCPYCSANNNVCMTLDQYAREQGFADDTTLQFCSGDHQLTNSLWLDSVQNLTFQGSSDSSINIDPWVNITIENCVNIIISSLTFNFAGNYSYFLVFKHIPFVQLSNVTFHGYKSFGCSAVMSTGSTISVTDSSFIGLHGWLGAALLLILNSSITLTGNNTFRDNIANSGGAIYPFQSHLHMKGISRFINNTVKPYALANNTMTLCCKLRKIEYIKGNGGAVFSYSSTLEIEGDSRFIGNSAEEVGSGGAIAAKDSELIMRDITCIGNSAGDGGAISVFNTALLMSGIICLENNTANWGGALHMGISKVVFSDKNSNSVLSQNSTIMRGNIAINQGGGIRSRDSIINFTSNVVFDGNGADTGGAMTIRGSTRLIFDSKVYFIQNHANYTGGAIQVDNPTICLGFLVDPYFFLFTTYTENVPLVFVDNTAGTAGNVLFGGQIDICKYYLTLGSLNCEMNIEVENHLSSTAIDLFLNKSMISPQTIKDISSKAEKIQICDTDCNTICNTFMADERSNNHCTDHHLITVYPGKSFNITIIPLGQANYPAPANIVYQPHDHHNLILSHTETNNSCLCHEITYHLNVLADEVDTNHKVEYKFFHEGSCNNHINLTIDVLKCPTGFALSKVRVGENVRTCMCSEQLRKFSSNCYIENLAIERRKNDFWISPQGNTSGLILHKSGCPFDFCKHYSINVTLQDPSVQCDFNRTGILCGACKDGYSLTLGNLHCSTCSNSNISLVIIFALAGMALVAIIFLLRLTVAVGTCNGLIFYANIIQANYYPFFPRATINFFTVFISWLNLDFGIEACFYNGMNIYMYSWLQFIFPLYVWFLIGSVVLGSHYSQRIARCFGQNPVAVLATLLLMSYSKISNAIITPLSWTYLTYTYPSEEQHTVWLNDGSIDFFRDHKHFALALFAVLVFLCVFLPYTLLLLNGYWLQAYTHWPILSWLNKIKPFMDAYYAPYKRGTRYWTGLLLLARAGLFLTFTFNTIGSGSVNLLATSSVATALAVMKGRVYEKQYNDILESSFILNLCIFSVATFYIKEEGSGIHSQYVLSSVSVGVASITFIGIIIFHMYVQIKKTIIWNKVILFAGKFKLLSKGAGIAGSHNKSPDGDVSNNIIPTSSIVELRESLLELSSEDYT